MSRRSKAILVYLLVILLFAGMTFAYTRPLVSSADDSVMESAAGDTLFNMYVISWTSHVLFSRPLGFFNATIFYPNSDTLAYSDIALSNSIIAMPVLWASGNLTLAFNFVVIINFLLSAIGAFLLVDYLARDKLAAFAAGLIYGFALYKLVHLPHMQVLSTGYIPLAVLCLHAYTEKKKARYAAGFCVFTVLTFWAAWGIGFFLAYTVLVYLVVLALVERRRILSFFRGRYTPEVRRKMIRWGVGLIAAFLAVVILLLPFVVPYLRVARENPDFQRDIDELYNYSADVGDFLVASERSLFWGSATGTVRPDPYLRGNASERSLFTGVLPLLLALAGFAWLLRRPDRRSRFVLSFYSVLLVLTAVMCLGVTLYLFGRHIGIPMPYRVLYHLFPGFKAIRTPGRMVILVSLALAVLGGFGIKWLRGALARRVDRVAVTAVALLVVALLAAEMLPSAIPMARVPAESEIPGVYRWLDDKKGETPVAILPLGDDPDLPPLERGLNYAMVEPLRMYYNTVNWKSMVNGYSGYIPVSYRDAVEATAVFPSEEALLYFDSLGVEYMIVEEAGYDPLTVDSMLEWAAADDRLEAAYREGGYLVLQIE